MCMYLYEKVSYNLFVLQYFKQKDSRPENSGRENCCSLEWAKIQKVQFRTLREAILSSKRTSVCIKKNMAYKAIINIFSKGKL